MTTFIDTTTPGTLTDYNGLLDAIGKWLDRADFGASAPVFVQMAEARFRRDIVVPEMEKTVTLATGGSIALPVDFDSARSLYVLGEYRSNATQVAPSDFYNRPVSDSNLPPGFPTVFTVVAGQILFSPAPTADAQAVLTYQAKLPSLSAAVATNWLLASHPDLYLYGSLLHAEFFGWNDERLPTYKAAVDEMIAEINMAGNRKRYGASPLVMKSAVKEWV